MEADIPRSREDLNRLFVTLMEYGGYYHPLELDGIRPEQFPRRLNVRTVAPGYYDREWALIDGMLRSVFPDGLVGKTVLDGGPADGFFTLRCARAGARVQSVEPMILMMARTAIFSALAGCVDRVQVRFQSVRDFASCRLGPDPALGSGADDIDVVLALGLIYHFDDLVGDLRLLVALRRPIVFEFASVEPSDDTPYDPSTHRDPQPVPLKWLRGWLDDEGFSTVVEPAWREYNIAIPDGAKTREMVLAVPR